MPKGPSELPRLGAPIADTHAHLDMLDDPAGALERAAIAGVAFVVTVADVTEAPGGTFENLQSWVDESLGRLDEWGVPHGDPLRVRIIVGAHPHNAKDYDAAAEERLIELAGDPRVVGIGEIGLDFHYDHSPRDAQRAAFRAQLAIAHRLELPAIIHLREAHDEGLAIIEEIGVPAAGCVIHCFTGDTELVEKFVAMGCYVSFAGPVTFKNADVIRSAAAAVPIDRILTETDCPFMAPEPFRGTSNEPAWTVFTAERIAQVRTMSSGEFARAVFDNALRIFKDDRGPLA